MKTNEVTVLDEKDFQTLEKEILEMGYQEITRKDSAKKFLRLNLNPPRTIIGREASYKYTNNGYTVILHTSFLKNENKWRNIGTDAGWILIAEGDKPLYFARPFLRSKNFVIKFLCYAWITKWKVNNRPLCPLCKGYMDISRKYNSRQYFWSCDKNRHTIGKPVNFPWDYNLPPKALKFVNIRREKTKKYKAKIVKEERIVTPAAKIRRTWNLGNPQNLI